MGVAPSSATSMLKKLAALGLAEHAPYRGVELSEAGDQDRPRGHPPPPPARAVPRRDARAADRRRARGGRPARARASPRSSRRGSTSSSATRPTTRTATRSPTRASTSTATALRSLDALEPGEEATVRRDPRRRRRTSALPRRADALPGRQGDDAPIGAFRRPAHRGRGRERARHLPRARRPDRSLRLVRDPSRRRATRLVAEEPAFERLQELFLGEGCTSSFTPSSAETSRSSERALLAASSASPIS